MNEANQIHSAKYRLAPIRVLCILNVSFKNFSLTQMYNIGYWNEIILANAVTILKIFFACSKLVCSLFISASIWPLTTDVLQMKQNFKQLIFSINHRKVQFLFVSLHEKCSISIIWLIRKLTLAFFTVKLLHSTLVCGRLKVVLLCYWNKHIVAVYK